jgi:hypothetical protein
VIEIDADPVIAVPGETPTFPLIVVAPVLVTVELPSTAKLARFEPSNGAANPWVGP